MRKIKRNWRGSSRWRSLDAKRERSPDKLSLNYGSMTLDDIYELFSVTDDSSIFSQTSDAKEFSEFISRLHAASLKPTKLSFKRYQSVHKRLHFTLDSITHSPFRRKSVSLLRQRL